MIGLKVRQSQNIWRIYKNKGLSYLLEEHRCGTVGSLSYVQISHLQLFLRNTILPMTQQQVADWINQSFGVEYTQAGISVLFKRLKIKTKTGRPVNLQQDPAEVEALKKAIHRLVSSLKPGQIYCQDEFCYGTRTEIDKRWMPHGERPVYPINIGYE